MSRVGFGRHGTVEAENSDPLDGLVNLFDVGLVLAVAFLIAGLGLKVDQKTGKIEERPPEKAKQTTVTAPKAPKTAGGEGQSVGRVFRLPDGRLVLVGPDGKPVRP